MTETLFSFLSTNSVQRCFFFSDNASGLRAILVIDDVTLGPAAGGIRTWRYADTAAALADAAKLAHAMTLKCALAGLDAGGGKAVVLLHDDMHRRQAFEKLGEFIEELDGLFHTAGDLGTTAEDLAALARTTRHVEHDEQGLVEAVAVGLLEALKACARIKGSTSLSGLRILIQGCGAIGSAVARQLAQNDARLLLCDTDAAKASALADETGATVEADTSWLSCEMDIFCPCAIGGILTAATASRINAWAICGAANNLLGDEQAEPILRDRGILFVPDVIASAGAVIEGVGRSIMKLDDRRPLITGIGRTAYKILQAARQTGEPASVLAEQRALARIEAARKARRAR